jgi:hypothetical protein
LRLVTTIQAGGPDPAGASRSWLASPTTATVLAAFAARLKDAVDLDSVQEDLTGVVHQTLEPAHLSVWISRPD